MKNFILGFIILVSIVSNAQTDSTQTTLKFDFGITRDNNINLWPILKISDNNEEKKIDILFPFFSKNIKYSPRTKHLRFVPLFINDSSSQEVNIRILSTYYPSVFSFQKKVTPDLQIKTFRFLELAPNISGFSISRSPDGLFVDNNLFFFIWYKQNKLLNNTRFIVFPTYWYFSNDYKTTHLFVPLYYYKKSGEFNKRLNVALLYNYKKGYNKINHTFFPIYWNRKHYYSNDTIKKNILFPIYWSTKSKYINNKVVFPLVFSLKNQYYQSLSVMPLFSIGHSSDSSRRHLEILQLYWHFKTDNSVKNIVLPFWYSKTNYYATDTIIKKILFPVYWSKKNKNINNNIAFPLIYNLKNNYYNSLTIVPFFSKGQSTDSIRKHLVITPFYWQTENIGMKTYTVFPVYWNKNLYISNDTIKSTYIFPTYIAKKSNDKNDKILFPILFSLKSNEYHSLTILPLFSIGHSPDYSEKHIDILQLYWHFKTIDGQKNIVFPLWYDMQKYLGNDTLYKKVLFPLYWSFKNNSKNNQIFFPLAYSLKNNYWKSFTVLPLFSYGHSNNFNKKYLAITPFYWHTEQLNKSKRDILFPIYWRKSLFYKNDSLEKRVVFPLYWSIKSKSKSNKIFFPLVYSLKNNYRKSLTVLPLFSYGHNNNFNKKYLAITPFYWHIEQLNKSKRDIFFPIYWRKSLYFKNDSLEKRVVFPLYWSLQNKDVNKKILFPIVYSVKDKYFQSFSILPFFSTGHSTDYSKRYTEILQIYWNFKTINSQKTFVLPIWFSSNKYYAKDTISKKVLFPLYWSVKSNKKNNNILLPIVFKLENNYKKSLTVFPLFSYGQTNDLNNKYLIITPLYWHINRLDQKNDIFFPIYWSSISKNKKNRIIFPIIYSLNNDNYKSFTFFPVLSLGHSTSFDKKHFMFTPIFGIFNNKQQKNIFIFPIYNYKKTEEFSKSSVLFFLFRKQTSNGYKKTSILWPIYIREKSDTNSYFHIAPIIWYNKTSASKMFSIQPFFYYKKSNIQKNFSLFWILYRYENITDTCVSNSILWKFYTKDKYSNGDFETRLLYLAYANIDKDGKREKSILPFYHATQDNNGNKSKAIGFGFYNYLKRHLPEINEYYEEERIFWFLRLRSNYDKLKSEGKEMYIKKK